MKKKLILSFALIFCIAFANIGSGAFVNAEKKAGLTDFHMNLQSQELADHIKMITGEDEVLGEKIREINADTLISEMDRAGVDKALCVSNAYIWGMGFVSDPVEEYEAVKAENNWAALQAGRYPCRLTPFFAVNPLKDYAIKEMDRCYDVLKMPALKLQFANSNVDLENSEHLAKVKQVLAHAESRGIPVMIHFMNYWKVVEGKFSTRDAQIFIDEVLAKHPRLRVCITHMGGTGGYDGLTGDIFDTFIKAYATNKHLNKKNLYFDIADVILIKPIEDYIGVTTEDQLKRISSQLKAWGLDRILWGSDFYGLKPDEYLHTTMSKLKLSDKDMHRLLYKDPKDFMPNLHK